MEDLAAKEADLSQELWTLKNEHKEEWTSNMYS